MENCDESTKLFWLNDKTYIETSVYGQLCIPTIIKAVDIETKKPLSSPPFKKIRLSAPEPSLSPPSVAISSLGTVHFGQISNDTIGEISTFLTFRDYFSFMLISKRIHQKLIKPKLIHTFDAMRYVPTDKDKSLYKKLKDYPQLKHLYAFAEDLERIDFSTAKPNLTRLSLNGEYLDSLQFISSSNIQTSSIDYLQLSCFGSLDDPWSFLMNFSPVLFPQIRYLFMDHCDMQHTDCTDKLTGNINTQLFTNLVGYGNLDGLGEYSPNVPFTNWVLEHFGSNLEVLHIQADDGIVIPTHAKFNQLKELRIILSKYNDNNMNLINSILSKIDKDINPVKRFAFDIFSLSCSERTQNLKETIQTLMDTQHKLQEVIIIDDYEYRSYIYDAITYALYLLKFTPQNTMSLTIKFRECYLSHFQNARIEASEICATAYRLLSCLMGCYESRNWRLHMQFTGNVSDIYDAINEDISDKLRNNYQFRQYWNGEHFELDTFSLEIQSKRCIIPKPDHWIFPMEQTDFGQRHEFVENIYTYNNINKKTLTERE